MELIFATNNPHKLMEIQHMLGNEFHLSSLKDLNFVGEIPENQDTLEGNALEKARFIFDKYKRGCFADDTGLEVEALDGAPGVYSARYAGTLAEFGTETNRSMANINKLLQALSDKNNRKARFRTVIAFISDSGKEFLFEGIVNGFIISDLRGSDGFGYDPVFVPEGYSQTFAEMPLSEKNKISHRARAFKNLRDFLVKNDNF